MKKAWHNLRTGQRDALSQTPTDLRDYIPQYPASQNLYALLVEATGKTPLEAALHILSISCGRKVPGPAGKMAYAEIVAFLDWLDATHEIDLVRHPGESVPNLEELWLEYERTLDE